MVLKITAPLKVGNGRSKLERWIQTTDVSYMALESTAINGTVSQTTACLDTLAEYMREVVTVELNSFSPLPADFSTPTE